MASRSANVDEPHTAMGMEEPEGIVDGAVLAAGVFSLSTGAWSSGAAATMAGGHQHVLRRRGDGRGSHQHLRRRGASRRSHEHVVRLIRRRHVVRVAADHAWNRARPYSTTRTPVRY